MGGCALHEETLLALLCSSPLFKVFKSTWEFHKYLPGMEVELDAFVMFISPWICDMLEVFNCKVTRVPRPDIAVTEVGFGFDDWVPIPPFHVPSRPIALQESHDLQREVLKQLDRLNRLCTLSLGTLGYNIDDPIYSQLEIKEIRTMIVESAVQTDCPALTLESGLDKLVSEGTGRGIGRSNGTSDRFPRGEVDGCQLTQVEDNTRLAIRAL